MILSSLITSQARNLGSSGQLSNRCADERQPYASFCPKHKFLHDSLHEEREYIQRQFAVYADQLGKITRREDVPTHELQRMVDIAMLSIAGRAIQTRQFYHFENPGESPRVKHKVYIARLRAERLWFISRSGLQSRCWQVQFICSGKLQFPDLPQKELLSESNAEIKILKWLQTLEQDPVRETVVCVTFSDDYPRSVRADIESW